MAKNNNNGGQNKAYKSKKNGNKSNGNNGNNGNNSSSGNNNRNNKGNNHNRNSNNIQAMAGAGICKFFANDGSCRSGNNCKFSHNMGNNKNNNNRDNKNGKGGGKGGNGKGDGYSSSAGGSSSNNNNNNQSGRGKFNGNSNTNTVCQNLLNQGSCANGDNCAYSHDVAPKPICDNYLRFAECKNGDRCAYSHDLTPYLPNRPSEQSMAQPGYRAIDPMFEKTRPVLRSHCIPYQLPRGQHFDTIHPVPCKMPDINNLFVIDPRMGQYANYPLGYVGMPPAQQQQGQVQGQDAMWRRVGPPRANTLMPAAVQVQNAYQDDDVSL